MKNIGIILCCIAFWQCNQQKTKLEEFILVEPLAAIVDSFTEANPGQKVYELYIDKVSVDSSIITLYAGDQSISSWEKINSNRYPLITIFSNNNPINLYSGMEGYIKTQNMLYDSSKLKLNNDDIGGVGCIIFDIKGKLRVDKEYSKSPRYPFFPLPHFADFNRISLPPNMTIDNSQTGN